MGLQLNSGPTFSFLPLFALYFLSRCCFLRHHVILFSSRSAFLHIIALFFILLLCSLCALLYFVLLLFFSCCCSPFCIVIFFMLLLSSHCCSPLHLTFGLVICKIFFKKKLFILLSKMLSYPMDIKGDGYPVILKSGIKFLLFL
jgi:hypothetical protein